MFANLPNFAAIWRRLVEEFSDSMKAVKETKAVLLRMSHIGDNEQDRFVAYVDFF